MLMLMRSLEVRLMEVLVLEVPRTLLDQSKAHGHGSKHGSQEDRVLL